jgi:hypothetical protein
MDKLIPLFLLALVAFTPVAQGQSVLFREEFNNLDNWRPLYFPKIKRHTSYSVASEEGAYFLMAESRASASALVFKHEFDVFQYPHLRWRWKVTNVHSRGDARSKNGNDYPLRIYILFKYSPDQVNFLERLKYGVARIIYGKYPPYRSLNYIWANRVHPETIITDPHAKESKLILLQEGKGNVGKWVEEEVNLINDYRMAFDQTPPATATLAVMSDSDNTGESAIAGIDFIEVYR